MRRRRPDVAPLEAMPAELRTFDEDRWPRDAWLAARLDWCETNGIDWLQAIRLTVLERHAGPAGRRCDCSACSSYRRDYDVDDGSDVGV